MTPDSMWSAKQVRDIVDALEPYYPRKEDEETLANMTYGAITEQFLGAEELSDYFRYENTIHSVPPVIRKQLIAGNLITPYDYYVSIRGVLSYQIHGADNDSEFHRMIELSSESPAQSIYQTITELPKDETVARLALHMFRTLVRFFVLTEDLLSHCDSCRIWKIRRWSDLEEFLIQTMASVFPLIMTEIAKELSKSKPRWNPQWSIFRTIFTDNLKKRHGKDLVLSHGIVVASHIVTHIETYWFVERYLADSALPSELRKMIFDHTLALKKVQTPPPDLRWPSSIKCMERSRYSHCWQGCRAPTVHVDSALTMEALYDLKRWKMQCTHIHGVDHSVHCRCKLRPTSSLIPSSYVSSKSSIMKMSFRFSASNCGPKSLDPARILYEIEEESEGESEGEYSDYSEEEDD